MAIVYQYGSDGFYRNPTDDYGGPMPHNCTRTAPPAAELPAHHRWRWDGAAWQPVEDYRGLTAYRPDGESYTVKTPGPLPEGDCLEPPPPTPEDEAKARMAEIKARLNAIDQALIRGLDARDEGTATAEDEAVLAELRAEKRALRAELTELSPPE